MAIGTGAALLGSAALGIGGAALSKPKSAKDPYAFLRDDQDYAAGQARDLYSQGGPQVYGGSTVAPMSDTTQTALQQQIQRAQSGNPLVGQAQDFISQGLQQPIQSAYGAAQNPFAASVGGGASGNPFGGGANPFGAGQNPGLDAAFDHAAQKSRSGLESEFARGGRNISASAPVRGDMLSSLAAQIYAPAYEAERNRELSYGQQQLGIGAQGFENAQQRSQGAAMQGQQIGAQGFENAQSRQLADIQGQRGTQLGMLGYASPLAAQDYMDIAQMRDAGSVYDQYGQAQLSDQVNRFNQQQQAPQNNLDAMIARLSGLAGGTGPLPAQAPRTDYLSAGLGGALLGSQMFGAKPQPYTLPTDIAGMSQQANGWNLLGGLA